MWAKVDDGWWKHRKTMLLSLAARGLWATALSYCGDQRSGDVPEGFVLMVCPEGYGDLVSELVAVGLWDKTEDGWEVHDWDEYQSSAGKADAGRVGGLTRALHEAEKRAEAAERELEFAQTSKQSTSNGQAPSKQNQAGASTPPSTGPEPEPEPKDQTHVVDDQFEKFWTGFPRGPAGKPGGDGAKKPTLQKWRRLGDDERGACMVAVGHYRDHVESPDGPRACHALTWLNQERWEQWQEPAKVPDDDRYEGGTPPEDRETA